MSEPAAARPPGAPSAAMRRAGLLSLLAFLVALVTGAGVVLLDLSVQRQAKRGEALILASTHANLLYQRLGAALSSTYVLAAVLRRSDYVVDPAEFEKLASELLRYHPGVSSLQYAPNGITKHVVPLAGNEKAIGNNLLLRNDRNREALQAVETRKLTIAGPFELRQGGIGLAGRLPIFVAGSGDSADRFWGFAVALLRIEDLIASAEFEKLRAKDYDFALWRVHPDTGKRHVFAGSRENGPSDPVDFAFDVPNGRWTLSVAPRAGWNAAQRATLIVDSLLALAFAGLVAAISFVLLRQPVLLRQQVDERTSELADEARVRRAAEAQLRLAASVFESSAEAIMITDPAERIVSVNRAFTTITGYSAEEVLGKTPAVIASGRHDVEFFAAMRRHLAEDGRWHGEVWNRRKNGDVFPQWLGISALRDESGQLTHYVSISSDISERKASEDRINYLAHYDVLTGLPNRLLLRDRLQQAMIAADRAHAKVSVLALDLDRFKVVNDTLGHESGDALLRQVVGRLKELMRGSDTISRQGGDEFVIVIADVEGAAIAARIAQKIQDRLGEPFNIGGTEVRVTSSIGIAVYPDDGVDFETLLKKCDIAMYQAKESGRATYRFFADATQGDAAERLQLEAEMARAIERREFVLHYQPQIDLASGAVIGAEALIRWQHPEKGMVPPGRFIPVAEESGLIVPIGDWVLREACRQIVAWLGEGLPPIAVSVNLSGVQFRRPGLVMQVADILAQSGVAPELLELELTESILIHDAEQVLQTVRELKALGVKLAIDDFGTGYSSLSYLKRFAVDKLKIDQSFIRDLCIDAEDAAIVQAVIQLGRSLNLQTIAEGAETSEQVGQLRQQGCLQVQGYFYSKPLPAAEFAAFIRQSLAAEPPAA